MNLDGVFSFARRLGNAGTAHSLFRPARWSPDHAPSTDRNLPALRTT
jgi:hypothetical protein